MSEAFLKLNFITVINALRKCQSYDCKDQPDVLCGLDVSRDHYLWFNGRCRFDMWNENNTQREFVDFDLEITRPMSIFNRQGLFSYQCDIAGKKSAIQMIKTCISQAIKTRTFQNCVLTSRQLTSLIYSVNSPKTIGY